MNADSLPDTSTTGRHIPALDGMRGLAIMLVLFTHLLWSNPMNGSAWYVRMPLALRSAGWIGVDLFFVLSGFLITGILYDTLPAKHFFRNFYARRALRIFPLYYGFLLLLFVASRLTGAHWNRNAFHVLTYTSNILPGGLVTDAWWVNINHFWSLAIEEQFYLVWPLLVFLLRTRPRIALVAGLGALASFSVRLRFWHTPALALNPYLLYSWTPARLDGLLTGACLAVAIRSRYAHQILLGSRKALYAGLLALALLFLRFPGFNFITWPSVGVFLPVVLALTFAAMIAAGIQPHTSVSRFFSRRTLRYFGRYSYGLYVFHPTIAMLTGLLRPSFAARLHSKGAAVLLEASLALSLSIAAAWLSFRYFEQPCLRFKDHFHDSSHRPKLHRLIAEADDVTNTPDPMAAEIAGSSFGAP